MTTIRNYSQHATEIVLANARRNIALAEEALGPLTPGQRRDLLAYQYPDYSTEVIASIVRLVALEADND